MRRQQDGAWYAGGYDQLVPAVALDEGRAVVCPFCPDGLHLHDCDGTHHAGCNLPRARYIVRSLPPAAFVRLALKRLGFQPHQVEEILDDIARTQALRGSHGSQR
jgi:hypothetical protein